MSELVATEEDGLADAVDWRACGEGLGNCLDDVVPEVLPYDVVYPFVSDDGEASVFGSEEEKHPVAQPCVLHSERIERFYGGVDDLRFGVLSDVDVDFAAGVCLGLLYSILNA